MYSKKYEKDDGEHVSHPSTFMQEPWQTLLNQSKTWELIVEDASSLQRKPILKNSVSTPWQCCQFWFCKCHFFVPPKQVRKKAYEKKWSLDEPWKKNLQAQESTLLVLFQILKFASKSHQVSCPLVYYHSGLMFVSFFVCLSDVGVIEGCPCPFEKSLVKVPYNADQHLEQKLCFFLGDIPWGCVSMTIVGSVPKTQCISWCSDDVQVNIQFLSSIFPVNHAFWFTKRWFLEEEYVSGNPGNHREMLLTMIALWNYHFSCAIGHLKTLTYCWWKKSQTTTWDV